MYIYIVRVSTKDKLGLHNLIYALLYNSQLVFRLEFWHLSDLLNPDGFTLSKNKNMLIHHEFYTVCKL